MVKIKNKSYRVIISDFDGTLAGKDKVVSKPVKEAIKKLKEIDVTFLVASGRNFHGIVEDFCKEIGLTGPQITCGGGEIVDPTTKRVISAEYIPEAELRELYKLLVTKEIDFWMEKDFIMYTRDKREYSNLGPSLYKDIKEIELKDIPKLGILPIENPKIAEKLETELTRRFKNLHIIRSFSPVGRTFDITGSMGNKQEAVLKVSRLLKVPTKEIIGIGDGYNDFPLLEVCGWGVAMGNAHEELKIIADEVVPSYQEDGVAVFIDKLITSQN